MALRRGGVAKSRRNYKAGMLKEVERMQKEEYETTAAEETSTHTQGNTGRSRKGNSNYKKKKELYALDLRSTACLAREAAARSRVVTDATQAAESFLVL